MHPHNDAVPCRNQRCHWRSQLAIPIHDRINPVTRAQVPDDSAYPRDQETLPKGKWTQRPAFGIEELAFTAAAAQQRIEQRGHCNPAQEIEIYIGENKDL